jgi:hypothetical protein
VRSRVLGLAAMSFLLAGFFLAAVPAGAQSVDERIKVLEQELAQLKAEQIEIKKEAAAEMPTFSYRPGNGLRIEAADKSWSVRFGLEAHFIMEFQSGRDQVGRTQGEINGRRFRPEFYYCINNCLYELEAKIDLDGFGTGNAHDSVNVGATSILQRGVFHFHAEQLSPWLPTVSLGMDLSTSVSLARLGSASVGAQADYDLHTRNSGFNTGRAGQGILFNWDDRSLSSIGIPGRIGRAQIAMASIGEGDDGKSSFTDRKDFNIYGNISPFSQLKDKWIQGLTFEMGAWFCNVDHRAQASNACNRYRIQDQGVGGRQTLFDTGTGSVGEGLHHVLTPGIMWQIGPYTLRSMGHFQRSEDRGGATGKKRGNSFLIAHDLFLWSPNGFLTGSPNAPGSVLVGTHFERVDMACTIQQKCAGINGGQFHRDRVLLREWDVWYFVAPRMSVGVNWLWYDVSNLRNGLNQAAHNLGVCKNPFSATCRSGIGGDWMDVFLNWRYTF